mmetsp:Transcript_12673/g.17313  ORF Transcript_12673/g.17313 Transcript_12673/m.17313 type:complete len:227 (+) Transcript_12673:1538-2218(+)
MCVISADMENPSVTGRVRNRERLSAHPALSIESVIVRHISCQLDGAFSSPTARQHEPNERADAEEGWTFLTCFRIRYSSAGTLGNAGRAGGLTNCETILVHHRVVTFPNSICMINFGNGSHNFSLSHARLGSKNPCSVVGCEFWVLMSKTENFVHIPLRMISRWHQSHATFAIPAICCMGNHRNSSFTCAFRNDHSSAPFGGLKLIKCEQGEKRAHSSKIRHDDSY